MTIDTLGPGALTTGGNSGLALYGGPVPRINRLTDDQLSQQDTKKVSAASRPDASAFDVGSLPKEDGQFQGAGRTEEGRFDRNECQTCKNRKYQDGSDDPGVSFKTPAAISADQSATAVMGHEQEHVTRNAQKAKSEGRKVISSTVRLQNAVCPECGRVYVAGGETRTVTAADKKQDQENADNRFSVGTAQAGGESGKLLNAVA